jgi:hypothetical protein
MHMDFNPSIHRQRIVDILEIPRSSLMLWRATRPLFGGFTEAICYWQGDSQYRYAAVDPSHPNHEDHPIDSTFINTPGLILIDEHGNDLWLSGCGCGYTGEGPTATAYILFHEGFSEDHINRFIPHCASFHLVKDESEPAAVIFLPGHAEPRPVRRKRPMMEEPPEIADHVRDLETHGYFDDVAVEER